MSCGGVFILIRIKLRYLVYNKSPFMSFRDKLIGFVDLFVPSSIKKTGANIDKYRIFIIILLLAFFFTFLGDVLVNDPTVVMSNIDLYISYLYSIIPLLLLWIFKNLKVPINILIVMIIVNTSLIAIRTDGIFSNVLNWFIILPVIALTMIGPRTAIVWSVVLILNFVLLFYLPSRGLTAPFGKNGYLFNHIAVFISFFAIILLFWKNQKDLLKRIKKQDKILNSKKFAELEMKALQSQMNPHFIFNALQAIQDFVAGKDERSANKYMANFSKLMRLFLESSKEKYLTLEEELELLGLYVELEQLRFDPPFDYQLDCPESIDWGTLQIPSMLLQPFVENAINHGLKYKKGQGFVKIEIREDKEKDQLLIQIIDNGVGIKKAKEIKQQSTKSYKSRSMDIIEERLKTIQFVDDIEIGIAVNDRIENNQVQGTIVEITCPIL